MSITKENVVTKENLVINRQCCPICKSRDRTILFKAKHNSPEFFEFIKLEKFLSKAFYDVYNKGAINELLFEIAECNFCHFIYLTEVLNDKGMELLYNEWLDQDLLKAHYQNQKYSTYEEGMVKVIKKHFKNKAKINVMDFGAGYGNFCAIAAKQGANTYAFDLSTDKNDHMNNMGVTIINNFDNYKGYFDLIYVNQVVEHVSDPGGILNGLKECLTDNGIIFIATPNCRDVKKIIKRDGLSQRLFNSLSPHQHINAFDNDSLKRLAKKAGLKPLSIINFFTMLKMSFSFVESKFWIKTFLKNSMYGTFLFFSPIINESAR